ncbi:hypothetical protein ACFQ22_12910 [Lentilactobacillus raoultii]|uniref:Surface layer protein A domain-containing protein n=1 Tax=Lentilactobacillus raoultii TaxID=1987503 RepID=A0ABW3PRK9_9LACO|nr:hypothetical protein [Lentilactobacillus raoultii]
MFKKRLLSGLIGTGLALTVGIGISTPASASQMPGSLTYRKTDQFAKIGSNYKQFKLYNHVPNSHFKAIKTISWRKAGLSDNGITNSTVHIDLYATQGTQYNWYRISKATILRKHQIQNKKAKKYWVYGQALIFPKTTTVSVFQND